MRDNSFYLNKLMSNIRKDNGGCWSWQRALNKDGYGQTCYKGKQAGVHRLMMILQGYDVTNKVVDHICRNRSCCNPDHLRLVSTRENIHEKNSLNVTRINKEKTHCINGHEFTQENTKHTMAYGKPRRYCRTCKREATARHRQKISLLQSQ